MRKNTLYNNIDTGNTDEEIRHRVHFKKDATDRKGNKEETSSCLFLRWESQGSDTNHGERISYQGNRRRRDKKGEQLYKGNC